MRLWEQTTSAKFVTEMPEGGNHCQQYSFEILNFARPDTTDSHTATMTAERRKLREQLPRLVINTDVTINNHPQENNNSSLTSANVMVQSPDQVTQDGENGARVKFAEEPSRRTQNKVDVVAGPDNESNEDHNKLGRKKKQKYTAKQLKAFRRASAPAKGMDYYFKNAKQANHLNDKPSIDETNHDHKRHKLGLSIPTVHVEEPDDHIHEEIREEIREEIHEEIHDEIHDDTDNINNNNRVMSSSMSSSITSSSSIIFPCDPPSLSPCSSTSSLSSSVDMLSPSIGKQPNFSQPFVNPWSIRTKAQTISNDNRYKPESTSLPDLVTGSYGDAPWSPAALFLSNFAHPNIKQSMPDEEGQQVGEYIIGKVIGRGGFSTVKQAYTIDNYSGSMETVAVKIVRNHPGSEDNDRVQALLEREIAIWNRLDHPNILPMLSTVDNDYATFIFSEYCPGGTLLQYIKEHERNNCEGKGLDEDEARNIFLEIAESIRYLHNDMRLVHKDIKLDNILLDKENTWKICDFGLTEFQNSEANGFDNILYSEVGGSLAYCAPEQLRSPIPIKDPSVDIWSLGVVLFAIITGQLPFSDSFEPRLQLKILNGRYDESLLDYAGVSDELRDLLRGMFKTKPDQRLTISQVLEHQWCER